MKQHASRLFLILTTALLFLGTTGSIQSQPVLRLMGSQTLTSIYEGMRCGISITESGNVLAWWREVSGRDTPPKGSQWLTTVGEKLDVAMPDPDTVSCFHYVTDTLWSGLFFTREDLTTVGIWSTVLKIQFCRGTGDTVEDTSDVFASAGEWVRHDANIDSWAMDEFLAARGDTLFFAISEKFSGFNAIPVGGLAFRLDRWVAGEKEVFSLHEHNEHK
ncbi:MAG: hypothetical protein KFH87_00515, partial [Bacteroidetes bacterium]|nr:hypothetical protein [Bacteroidota bacterium]